MIKAYLKQGGQEVELISFLGTDIGKVRVVYRLGNKFNTCDLDDLLAEPKVEEKMGKVGRFKKKSKVSKKKACKKKAK